MAHQIPWIVLSQRASYYAHHRMPPVAHHTDVQLIAGGPLATLFAGGGPPVGHQWQILPSDCRRCATGGPPGAFLPLIATGLGLNLPLAKCTSFVGLFNNSLITSVLIY